MARVEKTSEKLAALDKKHAKQREEESEALEKLETAIFQKRELSNQLEQEGSKKNRKALQELGAELEKLEDQLAALNKTRKQNALDRFAEYDKLNKELKKREAQLNRLKGVAGKLRTAFSGIGGAIAGGLSIGGIMAALDKTADKLDSLAKRGRDIGLTASQLQEFEHQAKLAGVSAENLDVSVKAFNRNISLAAMGTGEAKQALASMGISLTKANGATKSQSELLRETADYFAKNAGAAENAGLAARIFGESGAELLRVFEQGGDAVDKIFNAKGIDEAASAAERYKDAMENVSNFVTKELSRWVQGYSDVIDLLRDMGNLQSLGTTQYERHQEQLNEKTRKWIRQQELAKREAENRILAEEAARREKLQSLDDKLAKAREGIDEKQLSTQERVNNLAGELEQQQQKLLSLDQKSAEYAGQYEAVINTTIALEKESLKLAEEKAKELDKQQAAEKKRLSALEAAENKLKAAEKNKSDYEDRMKESRAEFELQTKIDILKKQGREDEAKQLESLQKRNELIEKYGYSLEQATKIQKTLNALENPQKNTFSDEAKKKAQRIVDRGKGGTVGDKTLAEAKAILEGKTPEGGFTSSMFEKYNGEGKAKSPIDSINVNTKAEASALNSKGKDAQTKNEEKLKSLDTEIKNQTAILTEIKNAVQGIFTKRENNSSTTEAA